jgi:hypoxia up-regulated 1
VFQAVLRVAFGDVIGLDFGSDSMKVALVQPGKPIEIVTNFQSKRKTPTCITFYKGERMFGSDSFALMPRKPELSFTLFNRMLGRGVEDPLVKEVNGQYFPYEVYSYSNATATEEAAQGADRFVPAEGSLLIRQVPDAAQKKKPLDEGEVEAEVPYNSPEELMAMMMRHANDITLGHGGKRVKDVVITVPSYYTQHERIAIQNAAEIADLRVLSLVEENTAAALHYSIDRVYEEPYTVLFYNMGASSVQVSVVKYHSYTVKEGGKNKSVGQFEVLGKGWDRSLGGFNFDVKLAELLADKFNAAWSKKKNYPAGGDLRNFVIPMTKLRTQANKVKEVLSANPEFPVRAEQLHAEVDLNTRITRQEFEDLCEELFQRVTSPIDQALAMAGISLDQVNAVELLGGGVRMPKVKKIIDDYFASITAAKPDDAEKNVTKVEVGQHLNGDEAMAMGAAFRAANLSSSFRVRKVGMFDRQVFGIGVQLNTLFSTEAPEVGTEGLLGSLGGMFSSKKDKTEEEAAAEAALMEEKVAWQKSTPIYAPNSLLPGKTKTVAITHDEDILCSVSYEVDGEATVQLPKGASKQLSVFNITGIKAFAKEHAAKELGVPKVLLTFSLDGSGVVTLTKAEAILDLPKLPEPVEEEGKEEEVADAKFNDDGEPIPDADAAAADKSDSDSEGFAEKKREEGDNKTDEAATEGEKKDDAASVDGKDKKEGDDASAAGSEKVKADKEKEAETKKSTFAKKAADKMAKDKADRKKAKEAKKKAAKKAQDENVLRVILKVNENFHAVYPPHMSPAQLQQSKAKLEALDAEDEGRRQREAALNELEAFIYSTKNRLLEDETELSKISTEEQRQAVLDMGNELEEWLYDAEAKDADVTVFKGKHKELRKLYNPIIDRHSEATARPDAIAQATKSLTMVKAKIANWTETRTWITEDERDKVLELVVLAEKWMVEKQEAQGALEPHVSPAFNSLDVPKQLKSVALAFDTLAKKKKPEPKKMEPIKLNITANANDTDSSAEGSGDGSGSVKIDLEGAEGAEEAGDASADKTENSESTESESAEAEPAAEAEEAEAVPETAAEEEL